MPLPLISKIPFLLASILCNYLANTRPNPPPLVEERTKYEPGNGTHQSRISPSTGIRAVMLLTVCAINYRQG